MTVGYLVSSADLKSRRSAHPPVDTYMSAYSAFLLSRLAGLSSAPSQYQHCFNMKGQRRIAGITTMVGS